jgi:hypothetical protein
MHEELPNNTSLQIVFHLLMSGLPSFTSMHFITTKRERKKHFKKSWKEIDEKGMELYFADFCRSFVVNEIHC